MTIVIGLMGPAGAGKSSIADHLVSAYGATRYSFAGLLKELAMNTLDLTHEQCWGTQAQKETVDSRYGFSPRWFLQRLGTEGCRKTFGEDFWSSQLISVIEREKPTLAVIEDARFINEANAIRKFGIGQVHDNHIQMAASGFVWRLETPGRETSADASHASEQEWTRAPHDHVIAPHMRGLPLLFDLVDEACLRFHIFPARHSVAL